MAMRLGLLPSVPDARDFRFTPSRRSLAALPSSFTLGPNMSPRDLQGDLGSCGPNTSDEHWKFDQKVEGIPVVSRSRLGIYYDTRKLMGTTGQDSGVDNRTMLQALHGVGAGAESLCPYDIQVFTQAPSTAYYADAAKNVIQTYATIATNLQVMKACIAGGLPFIFGFSVFQGIMSKATAASGKIPDPKPGEQSIGGHDILCFGYDDNLGVFKVTNHWDSWGVNIDGVDGCGTISYAYAGNAQLCNDFWVINAVPGQIVVPTPPTPPLPPGPPPNPGPGSIRTVVDHIFAVLESKYAGRPAIYASLVMAQQLVDRYLVQNPLGIASGTLQQIIDTIFAEVVAKVPPPWNWVLQMAQGLIDQYLASMTPVARSTVYVA